MDTVLSPLAVHTLFEKGSQHTELTESTCPRNVCRHRSEPRSQRRAVWSMEQDTTKSPLWWKLQSQTACVWSVNVVAQAAPAKSQTLTVLSPDAVARCVPAGWKSTPLTQSRWPSPDMTRSQFGTDHSFHVMSSETVARMGFVGWNAAAATALRCPRNVRRSWKRSTGGASKARPENGLETAPAAGRRESAPFFGCRGFTGCCVRCGAASSCICFSCASSVAT
mmetsp:Transcript_10386/g.36616  ORF Transcript_10386/g.36616 Transcript_10386/m.36616 type:complete len:223 (-) Transcript_10386:968-1636(-)